MGSDAQEEYASHVDRHVNSQMLCAYSFKTLDFDEWDRAKSTTSILLKNLKFDLF
jgi:hypothetical protein